MTFKVGDNVRVLGEKRVGEITRIIDETAIIKYSKGDKIKTLLSYLSLSSEDEGITPEKFDEAVKAVMYEVAEDIGDTDQLDGVLEIVGAVSARIKARLFDGGN